MVVVVVVVVRLLLQASRRSMACACAEWASFPPRVSLPSLSPLPPWQG